MKRSTPIILLFWTVVFISTASAQFLTSARLYLKQREWALAESSALKATVKDDKDEEAWFVLGQARFELKKYPEMIDAFNKSLEIKPEYREEIDRYKLKVWVDSYNAGIKYYNKGRDTASYLDTALDSLKLAIKAMPDSASNYYVSALSYYGKRDYANSTKMLETTLEKDPANIEAVKMLGQLHLQAGREKSDAKDSVGAAEQYRLSTLAFERLYEKAPGDVDNIINLIDAYERAGMNDKAFTLTSNCVKADPGNRICRFAFGVYLLKKDMYSESIEQFKAVVEPEPLEKDVMYKDATYNLGVAYLNWGVAMKEENDKKAEAARKAAKGKKKAPEEKEDMTYKEKFKAAVPYLEKVAAFRQDDAGIYQQLGKLYANLNMSKEAKAAFETADRLVKEGK